MKKDGKLEGFSGTIQFISVSPHGDPEGVVLDDGSFVKTPPHSLQAKKMFKAGAAIEGRGELLTSSPNRVFHHARVEMNSAVLADDSMGKDEREALKEKHHDELEDREDAKDEKMVVRGQVVAVGTKPKGEVDRILLSDGTSIHVPKETDVPKGKIKAGAKLEVSGKARTYSIGRFLRAERVEVI